MKKIANPLLLFVVFFFPLVSFSQSNFYHRVGDTIMKLDTIYWVPKWYKEYIRPDTVTSHEVVGAPRVGVPCEILIRHETETPLQVIGIAGVLSPEGMIYPPVMEDWNIDSTFEPEYFRLYQCHPDSLEKKIDLPFRISDPYRIVRIPQKTTYHDCCDSILYTANHYFRLYEEYLEKPITVTDSFYLGVTTYSMMSEPEGPNQNPQQHDNVVYPYGGSSGNGINGSSMCRDCHLPANHYRISILKTISSLPAGTVIHRDDAKIMYFFPILLIDTTFANPGTDPYTCPKVSFFRAVATWEDGGTLMWDVHARHRLWQVRICNVGESPDQFMIDTCVNVPYLTVSGLQDSTHHSAYIRAICEHYGDTLYSEWSNPIDLYTIVDIDSPDLSDNYVSLIPNPANDYVQVLSNFPMEKIELYDLKGTLVLSSGVSGVSNNIDVKSLPRGVYIMVIRNQQGTCTKKLVLR